MKLYCSDYPWCDNIHLYSIANLLLVSLVLQRLGEKKLNLLSTTLLKRLRTKHTFKAGTSPSLVTLLTFKFLLTLTGNSVVVKVVTWTVLMLTILSGTYVGANAYRVIASTNVPAGQFFIIFTPSTDTQMTYKYYPYTFSTEKWVMLILTEAVFLLS